MYHDFLGREIEDPEMDAMRKDAKEERQAAKPLHKLLDYSAVKCSHCNTIIFTEDGNTWEAGEFGSGDIRIETLYYAQPGGPEISTCPGCDTSLEMENYIVVEYDTTEEFGSIQIYVNLYGFHMDEQSRDRPFMWIDAVEMAQVLPFIHYWLPRVKSALGQDGRVLAPKCPACYASVEHTPGEYEHDGELAPDEPGQAFAWTCPHCYRKYISGEWGEDLQEQASLYTAPLATGNAGATSDDSFDPFLDADDLP